jgi:hypothetical protein
MSRSVDAVVIGSGHNGSHRHFSGAFAELGGELAERGLAYRDTLAATTASMLPDGRRARIPRRRTDGRELCAEDCGAYLHQVEEFGASIGTLGELLGTELHSRAALRLTLRLRRQLGHRDTLALTGGLVFSARVRRSRGRRPLRGECRRDPRDRSRVAARVARRVARTQRAPSWRRRV